MKASANVKEWLVGVAAKKVIKRVVVLVVSYISADALQKAGITIDMAHFQEFLTAAAFTGLTVFLNWVKVKYGLTWL